MITSDDVMLRGWNGKNIKCVIEKFVLAEEEPEAGEFAAIAVKHETRLADDLVGMSDEARAAGEEKFLASEAGQKLTEQGRKSRAKLVAEIHDSYWMYKPLQGHAVDVLQIEGLTFQAGNRHLTGRTESAGGGATLGGYWKRSAKVTIYVPNCRHVAVRGCEKAVDIKSLQANLILTTHGSQDRSYGADFAIRDIDGDVTIDQAPIRVIQAIRGNLNIQQTEEYTNTGTMHGGGLRTSSSPPPDLTKISDVTGDVSGKFVRADLHLEKIGGALDVINEYGNTTLKIDKPLSKTAHRILSHSGVVRATTAKADTAGIPIFAFTQTGTRRLPTTATNSRIACLAQAVAAGMDFRASGLNSAFKLCSGPNSPGPTTAVVTESIWSATRVRWSSAQGQNQPNRRDRRFTKKLHFQRDNAATAETISLQRRVAGTGSNASID